MTKTYKIEWTDDNGKLCTVEYADAGMATQKFLVLEAAGFSPRLWVAE